MSTSFNGYAISCNGLADAALDLSVSGGVPNYTFNWNNGAITEDISGLAAGSYEVVISAQTRSPN